MRANGFRESSAASTALGEISFEVHAHKYSESLKFCNSESHILNFSVLLFNLGYENER